MKFHRTSSSGQKGADLSLPGDCDVMISFPSHANVGQLAMDSIIASYSLKLPFTTMNIVKLGYIETDLLLPLCGYECFSAECGTVLCQPLEVYLLTAHIDEKCKTRKIVLIQQRSPVIKGKSKEYVRDILHLLIETFSCKSIIALTGGYIDDENGTQFLNRRSSMGIYVVSSHNHDHNGPVNANILDRKFFAEQMNTNKNDLPLGMSLCKLLLEESRLQNIESFVIGRLCNEGNNLIDGLQLAVIMIQEYLQSELEETITIASVGKPQSWNSRLFGTFQNSQHMAVNEMFA